MFIAAVAALGLGVVERDGQKMVFHLYRQVAALMERS